MITSREAAEAAKKYGLSLTDAAAIARLADTPEEADSLAAMFAPEANPNQQINDRIRGQVTDAANRRTSAAVRGAR